MRILLSPVFKKKQRNESVLDKFPNLQCARHANVTLSVHQSATLAFRVAATDSVRLCCPPERLHRVRWNDDKWMFCRCVCTWVVGTYNRTYLLDEELKVYIYAILTSVPWDHCDISFVIAIALHIQVFLFLNFVFVYFLAIVFTLLLYALIFIIFVSNLLVYV